MNDDRLSRESNREIFEAIVSQIADPETVLVRRMFVVLGPVLLVLGAAITLLAGMGWTGVLAFSSTYVPGVVLGWRIQRRRVGRLPS